MAVWALVLLLLSAFCGSVSLSTNSRWIVNGEGRRVKLACANWVSHNEPMLAEGLEKKPVAEIVRKIAGTGFNCVRFTWPTFMFTRADYGGLTAGESLDRFQLAEAKAGVAANNPGLLNLTVVGVHKAVVDELGRGGIMVVLDNHVSHPQWCCARDDGNGFFGDYNFDPDEWQKGLAAVARAYKNHPAVIGMSLRNELRGSRQNSPDWYKYMAEGAAAVHRESPDFLVIVSGLSYDTDLTFLKSDPLSAPNLEKKLVFEGHWYAFEFPAEIWTSQTNTICSMVSNKARNNYLFLTGGSRPFPVFLSEFGVDQRGSNEADNRYITCLLATAAEFDVDWALWTFQGSYIFRENKTNTEEHYGVMDFNWNRPRNQQFLDRLELIRRINQAPGSAGAVNYRIFHPLTGRCAVVEGTYLSLGDCSAENRSLWAQHQNDGELRVADSALCLASAEDGAPARVSEDCSTKWKYASSSGLHLAAVSGGAYLCLEDGSGQQSAVVMKKCLCLNADNLNDSPTCSENPQAQWFKLVPLQI